MAHGRKWLIGAAFAMALAVALILIAAGGRPSLAEDGIIYVDVDATGPTYDGTSWETAFTGLQTALDVVGAGQQIWVAAGVYTPTWQFDAGDPRSATFQMINEVAIYGGFDPSLGAVDFADRDWFLYETILSGDLNGDDGDDFANNDENSYHVFYHPDGTGLDDTAILDGFTITGGSADGLSDHNYGGGMYNDYSSPALANCAFKDNSTGYYGGGMYNKHASPALTNMTFEGNLASNAGGGMANYSGSSPTLIDCTFTSNRANGFGGGGMLNSSSTPTLTHCTFDSNWSDFGGGAMRNDSSPAMLANCTFIDNSAEYGGGMYNSGSSVPTLANCTFTGNSADYGGGMYNYYTGSLLTLQGCTFADNLATYGGGIYSNNSELALTNCTFLGNTAGQGGGIYNSTVSATLTNCILWGNAGSGILNSDSTLVVTYSDIEGDLYPGTGNINEDPLFVDPANGDLRLQLTSPAIDAGDNDAPGLADVTTDLGGNPRFADTPSVPDTGNGTAPIVDMGAYEVPPDIIYVDQDASGADDGSSWDNAFTDLQDALAWAVDGVEVWVAAGTYKPTSDIDRTASFQMVNGVSIYGGFEPSMGATGWVDRDWLLHESILSGDIGAEGDPADNCYHVVYNAGGLDSTAVLDGFTITGGNADGAGEYRNHSGGGMYNKGSSPTLVNLIFTDNSALDGGGMTNSDSSPELTNCTFTGNSANDGGGMINFSSSPTLTNCTFQSNSADQFGGGMINNGSATLTNCTFSGNSAGAYGGGMYNTGSSVPTLTSCTFAGNSATDGGGMYNTLGASPALTDVTFTGNSAAGAGGGMDNKDSAPVLLNCTFQGNTAGDEGGGMLNDGSSPTLTNCTFSANKADAGGGMHNSISSPTLTNVTFAGNEANSGGGMHSDGSAPVLVNCTFVGNSSVGHGGGMRNKGASMPTLTNCTFYGNKAINGTGGAIQNYESSYPTLTNCILWGDIPQEIVNFDPGSEVDVTYSDVEGDYVYPGAGNINEDPLFADPDEGDFHLLPASLCIDAGTDEAIYLPEHDFEGDPRSLDGDRDGTATADMGADEALWHPVYLPLVLKEY